MNIKKWILNNTWKWYSSYFWFELSVKIQHTTHIKMTRKDLCHKNFNQKMWEYCTGKQLYLNQKYCLMVQNFKQKMWEYCKGKQLYLNQKTYIHTYIVPRSVRKVHISPYTTVSLSHSFRRGDFFIPIA